MSKLTVKLKQHTPLIHFQAEQDGATLRATELKPKLDKFLVEHAFNYDFKEYEKFLVGDSNRYKRFKEGESEEDKKNPAFDYKVRIRCNNLKIIDIDNELNSSSFFGNIGKKPWEKKIKAVFTQEDIIIDFFAFKQSLLDKIEEYINLFFTITNFGTRQNKGFGSFYINSCEEDFLSNLERIRDKFLYIKYDPINYKELLEDISIIYTLMKSGINYPSHPMKTLKDRHGKIVYKFNGKPKKIPNYNIKTKNASYHKSFLFKYMGRKTIGNEKRFIKENFFQPYVRIEKDDIDKKYVRGLLGISDSIKFRDGKRYGEEIRYKSDIDRFKSPITFKVVDNIIAIIPDKIPDEIFEKEFVFEQPSGNNRLNEKRISTPTKDDFNLEDFLFEFADFFNENLKVSDVNNPLENQLRKAKQKNICKVGDNND
ncbi:hypothetical protein [Halonatronum saccharophilum]|uniref:hypothetical protein n=1 Tax=Halonatronum saccharophilum TaxID=150060 RepID=UPI0004B85904|nr:hypothetical protein [Halonatronum saccharophilum]